MISRYIAKQIQYDIEERVVLISGPRQVGKSTISRHFFPERQVYLNYDEKTHRAIIRAKSWSRDRDLVIFDELHKMPKWKSWIKGLYDTEGSRPRILVTGSARFETFKNGGDSLAGRHFLFRLHPFSVAELKNHFSPEETFDRILRFGGFPEPFLRASDTFAARWRRGHLDRILREDLLDLERVREIRRIEVLVDLLAERVGSTISYSSLARELEVSPHTVKHWIQILESLYVVFVITPYSKNLARSLLHEPKIYFFDTGAVTAGEGARFENAIATAMLKHAHFKHDVLGQKTALHYLRDKEKREVDFLLVSDKKIELIVEAKVSDSNPSPALVYYSQRLQVEDKVQVVRRLPLSLDVKGIKVRAAAEWLTTLS